MSVVPYMKVAALAALCAFASVTLVGAAAASWVLNIDGNP